MEVNHWTAGIIVICVASAFVGTVIGYLAGAMRSMRQASLITAQLEQAKQALSATASHHDELQERLRAAEARAHELQVSEGKLQTQLQAASDSVIRLSDELQTSKEAGATVQLKLERVGEQHHATERRLETLIAESRSLSDQVTDLRDRLAKAQAANDTLQAERDHLKDELAGEGKRARAIEASEREVREQLAEGKQALAKQVESFNALQERYRALSTEHAGLQVSQHEREEHFREQLAQLSDAKKSLTQEFENLANRIFEEKGKTFTQASQAGIDSLLKPFREQIEGFQKRVNEVHDASLQGNTSLNAEIKKVLEIGLQMSREATNLTSALKGDSQQRGAWGEAQLRRTLEMSGLIEDAHYEVQSPFKDTEGKHKQTDYLIKLPDGKHIIIDSKVSLVAYDRAVAAASSEECELAMTEHTKAVRKHIDELALKDYTNLVGMRSPSFVLMFMPIEPAYIEAMKHNKDLFEYGYKKGIVLVSHTTLIPILRTVSNLWMIERSNAEAREISEKAGDIYNHVCTVAERLGKLGGTLGTVANHYNETVKALAGKQGLYGKVDRFNKLSVKVSKSLPPLEPTHVDFESERLSLIVEAIEEPSTGDVSLVAQDDLSVGVPS